MTSNSDTKYQSVIKVLYMLIILSSLVYATAWADGQVISTASDCSKVFELQYKDATNKAEKEAALAEFRTCRKNLEDHQLKVASTGDTKALRELCEKSEKTIENAIKAYQNACGRMDTESDGTLKASRSCNSRALEKCAGGEDYMGSMANFGSVIGMQRSDLAAKCDLTRKDYFSRKDTLNKDIRELNKDIKGEAKELADIEQKKNDAIQKAMDRMKEQKKEFEKYKESLDDSLQKAQEDSQRAEIQAANQIQQLTIFKDKAREDLHREMAQANDKLIDVSEETANSECMRQAKAMYDDLNKMRSKKAGSLEGSMKGSSELKRALNNKFNSCIQKYDIARQEAQRRIQQLPEQKRKEIEVYDAQIAQAELQLKKIQVDRINFIAKLDTKKQQALVEAMQSASEANAQLMQAQQQARTETLGVGQNMLKNQMLLNAKFGELNTLGAEPNGGTSDKSVYEWAREFNAAKIELKSFSSGPCCKDADGEARKPDGQNTWIKRCDPAGKLAESESLRSGGK